MTQQATAQQPLAGIRIIELSTIVTASLSSMMLAAQDPELNRFGGPAPVSIVGLDSEHSSFGLSLGFK